MNVYNDVVVNGPLYSSDIMQLVKDTEWICTVCLFNVF